MTIRLRNLVFFEDEYSIGSDNAGHRFDDGTEISLRREFHKPDVYGVDIRKEGVPDQILSNQTEDAVNRLLALLTVNARYLPTEAEKDRAS